MGCELRPYQKRAAQEVRKRERGGRFRACLAAPTGSGKTIIMADLLLDGRRQLVLTHRRVLLEQLSKVLQAQGIRHGFRASGYEFDAGAPIQLAMFQSEWLRTFKNKRVPMAEGIERLHVDEIHANTGETCTAIYNAYAEKGASIIGYSATPVNLAGIVDDVYQVVTVQELIREGRLVQPLLFNCGRVGAELLERLRRNSDGEYQAGDLNKIIKPKMIFGHVKEHRRRLCPDNRPFALFAHSVKASLWWAQSLTADGIPTAHIDCNNVWVGGEFFKSDPAKRQEVFERLGDDLEGVSNRFVLREGWDCPKVGHIILTCPTALRHTYVQMCGRGLRPYGDREYAVIQDHSGSSENHPALDSDEPFDWQAPSGLAERVRKAKLTNDTEPEPIVCPKCMLQRFAGEECPYCGFAYKKYARYVLQVNGTLKLVEGKTHRPRRVTRRPDDAAVWERLYWATVKNGNRTAEQVRAYFAYSHQWRWLARDLPLMPRNEADWFRPLKDIPHKDLIKA